mmetsp:Transcript_122795/g.352683  ORF Transcript_122795/g.352683 Transcript_122795/m.352683 type:complete len:534 (+) Transcript_122795:1704-3305(+)
MPHKRRILLAHIHLLFLGFVRCLLRRRPIHSEPHRAQPTAEANVQPRDPVQPLADAELPALSQIVRDLHGIHRAAELLVCEVALDLADHVPIGRRTLVVQALQHAELPRLQEQLRDADGPVLSRDTERLHDAGDEVAVVVVLQLLRQHLREAPPQVLQVAAVRVAAMHDPDQLHCAALDDLIEHILLHEHTRLSPIIGIEAPDVVHGAVLQRRQQLLQAPQVLAAHRVHGLFCINARLVGQDLGQILRRLGQQRLHLRHEGVAVLVDPARGGIGDVAGVVPDLEAVVALRGPAGTGGRRVEAQRDDGGPRLDELLVNGLAELRVLVVLAADEAFDQAQAVVVEDLHDIPDAVDDRFVVRELPLAHREALVLVRPLLRQEHLFDEELLEALVREVDAQLLEAIGLEALETVDVQGPHAVKLVREIVAGHLRVANLARFVDFGDDVVEQPLVEDLDDTLQCLLRLRLGSLAETRAPVNLPLLPSKGALQLRSGHPEQVRRVHQVVHRVRGDLDPRLVRSRVALLGVLALRRGGGQ